jgi:hypothetical protein
MYNFYLYVLPLGDTLMIYLIVANVNDLLQLFFHLSHHKYWTKALYKQPSCH